MSRSSMAILELRGGTHLILRAGPVKGGRAPFDLMVEDIDQIRRDLTEKGVRLGPTRQSGIHRSFDLTDPDGCVVTITSSHAMGPV